MSVTFRIENERQGVSALAGAHPGSLPSSGAPPGPHHLATMRPEWQRPTAASRYGHRTWSGPAPSRLTDRGRAAGGPSNAAARASLPARCQPERPARGLHG